MQRFVIVGAGLAGHRAALELRTVAPDALITLIGDEPCLPYDRPPLSKQLMLGTAEPDTVILKNADCYPDADIAFEPSTTIAVIDRAKRRVISETGRCFPYDKLLLTTGSRARRLDTSVNSSSLHYLRTLDDAVRLRDGLNGARSVIIIGGGFIGLEIAAAARQRGCHVTVVETADRLLARGLPLALSEWIRKLHERNGVNIVLRQEVLSLETKPDGSVETQLGDRTIDAEIVVVGIGIIPNSDLAAQAGLEIADGIVVDDRCRTSDPDIFAAGEVTRHPIAIDGVSRRIESWQTASLQPIVAARSMAGINASFASVPWLWSDQFGHNIQMIGLPDFSGRCFLRGSIESDQWTMVAVDARDRPLGAVAVNNGRDISMLRRALTAGQSLLADRNFVKSFNAIAHDETADPPYQKRR